MRLPREDACVHHPAREAESFVLGKGYCGPCNAERLERAYEAAAMRLRTERNRAGMRDIPPIPADPAPREARTHCPQCGNFKAPRASACGECLGGPVRFTEAELEIIARSEDEIRRDFGTDPAERFDAAELEKAKHAYEAEVSL